jgi:hypothetical protein
MFESKFVRNVTYKCGNNCNKVLLFIKSKNDFFYNFFERSVEDDIHNITLIGFMNILTKILSVYAIFITFFFFFNRFISFVLNIIFRFEDEHKKIDMDAVIDIVYSGTSESDQEKTEYINYSSGDSDSDPDYIPDIIRKRKKIN